MSIAKLAHYTIHTADLAKSKRFYTEILNLHAGTRPDLGFPGYWLYAGEDETEFGVVHLVGIDSEGLEGAGAVDHIAFLATNWPEMKARCEAQGAPYDQRLVPALGLNQVFLRDPSGIKIELNYPIAEAETY